MLVGLDDATPCVLYGTGRLWHLHSRFSIDTLFTRYNLDFFVLFH